MTYVERNRRRVQPIVVKRADKLAPAAIPGNRAVVAQYGRDMEGRRSAAEAGDALSSQIGGRAEPARGKR
jgi:hypothetical protein